MVASLMRSICVLRTTVRVVMCLRDSTSVFYATCLRIMIGSLFLNQNNILTRARQQQNFHVYSKGQSKTSQTSLYKTSRSVLLKQDTLTCATIHKLNWNKISIKSLIPSIIYSHVWGAMGCITLRLPWKLGNTRQVAVIRGIALQWHFPWAVDERPEGVIFFLKKCFSPGTGSLTVA